MVPPTVRYKRDFEKDASAAASPAPESSPEPPVTEGPAEIHIEIKYPGEGLPPIELLHRRQAPPLPPEIKPAPPSRPPAG